MRSVIRVSLLITALALPVLVALAGVAFTDGPRQPRVPAEVSVGSSPGPSAPVTGTTVPSSRDLPPPPPDEDDDDADDDADDDLDDDD